MEMFDPFMGTLFSCHGHQRSSKACLECSVTTYWIGYNFLRYQVTIPVNNLKNVPQFSLANEQDCELRIAEMLGEAHMGSSSRVEGLSSLYLLIANTWMRD